MNKAIRRSRARRAFLMTAALIGLGAIITYLWFKPAKAEVDASRIALLLSHRSLKGMSALAANARLNTHEVIESLKPKILSRAPFLSNLSIRVLNESSVLGAGVNYAGEKGITIDGKVAGLVSVASDGSSVFFTPAITDLSVSKASGFPGAVPLLRGTAAAIRQWLVILNWELLCSPAPSC